MVMAIDGRSEAILLFKEFDKVRGVREGALVANLGDGFRC
jgi:hypothetical protein